MAKPAHIQHTISAGPLVFSLRVASGQHVCSIYDSTPSHLPGGVSGDLGASKGSGCLQTFSGQAPKSDKTQGQQTISAAGRHLTS